MKNLLLQLVHNETNQNMKASRRVRIRSEAARGRGIKARRRTRGSITPVQLKEDEYEVEARMRSVFCVFPMINAQGEDDFYLRVANMTLIEPRGDNVTKGQSLSVQLKEKKKRGGRRNKGDEKEATCCGKK